jgi:sugar phosphate isomerase/epimerase
MKPCISQATTLPTAFADDVSGYADGGCQAIEVWLTKLETHLETNSAHDTRQLLADRGVTLAAAAYQGGLLLSQGEQRRAHFEHFKRRLDLCQTFGIPMLVLLADFAERPDATALQRAVVSLAQAGQWAAGFGVALALEFRGADAFCASLDTAVALVEQCGEPNVGVCLDAFHYYKGPSKPEDLDLLTARNLAHVQLCDVAGVPRELMTDADRVFPGEGDFRLAPIVAKLRAIGYTGYVALELMNPTVWRSKPSQVAELGLAALTRTLQEPR